MGNKRELAFYLACGLASTAVSWIAMFVVNWAFFGGTAYPTPFQNAVLGLANWTAGMSSAYVMNRALVFRSSAPVLPEFLRFSASRVSTLVLDQLMRQALGMVGVNVYATTLLVTAVVTVLNYVISKLAVFHRTEGGGNDAP